jgi:hypothetical protein
VEAVPTADGIVELVSGATACLSVANGHFSRECCTHSALVNIAAVAVAAAMGAANR